MRKPTALFFSLVIAGGAFAACSDSESPAVADGADASSVDGSTSSTGDAAATTDSSSVVDSSSSTDATTDLDASLEQDGGLITDGGGNPDDPDAGPDDAGAADGGDAGTCGPAAGNGPALNSVCSSILTIPLGGTIVPGTYDLAGFTVTGSIPFCSTYTQLSYSGRLDVTANGGGFKLAERVARSGTRATSRTFDATVNNKFLATTQLCGSAVTSNSWGFSVGKAKGGKDTITYTHDSGSATVRYFWIAR